MNWDVKKKGYGEYGMIWGKCGAPRVDFHKLTVRRDPPSGATSGNKQTAKHFLYYARNKASRVYQ